MAYIYENMEIGEYSTYTVTEKRFQDFTFSHVNKLSLAGSPFYQWVDPHLLWRVHQNYVTT